MNTKNSCFGSTSAAQNSELAATIFRERNHSNCLPDGGRTGLKYSVARNVVVLAVDTVTSCCTVASRLNFDVKNATQGIMIHSCNLRMSIQADIILAAYRREYYSIFLIRPHIPMPLRTMWSSVYL